MEEKNLELEDLYKLLKTIKRPLIASHHNPDGDAIGSSLALYHFLKSFGHQAIVVIPNEIPGFLKWLPACNDILIYEDKPNIVREVIRKSDMVFYVDFNSLSRLEKMMPEFQKYYKTKILVDHHPGVNLEVDLSLSNSNVGSAAELVYYFISKYKPEEKITKEIAECIYTGMMTDTVDFRINVNETTYKILAELYKYKIDTEQIHSNVYDNFSIDRMRLLGFALEKKMLVYEQFHTAFIYLTIRDLKKYNFQSGDSEGFVNFPFSIKGIKFTALFIQKNGHIKISFRSKGDFSVNEFAKKHFNGGGHKNASGGKSFISLQKTIKQFVNLLPQYKSELG